MANSEKTPWYKWILIVASISTATTGILATAGWLFREKIQNYIISTVDDNKSQSVEAKLAEKMFKHEPEFKEADVCWKIGKLYRDFYNSEQGKSDILNKWVPYLEQETKWRYVGYFVSMEDPSIVKFHHWDGRDYDAWQDETGWFYVKGGFKYYK